MRREAGYPALDTPTVLVDLDALDRNLAAMAARARQAGVKLRPHTKTHKSTWIARRQLAAGAAGLTVAKLGEAEVMADAGLTDLLIAYPIVGEQKLERLHRLAERAEVIVALDGLAVAAGVGRVGAALGRPLPVYLDVDSGLGRCGRPPGAPSAELALAVARVPGVELRGLMTHAGHAYQARSRDELRRIALGEARALVVTARELARRGLAVPELSVGSTPTAFFLAEVKAVYPEITEARPGTYAFYDANQVALGVACEADCALRVLATVVSRPAPERLVVDAGSKTLGADAGAAEGFGRIRGYPAAVVSFLNEEHATIRVPADAPWQVGDRIELVPNHACIPPNLTDALVLVRDGAVVGTIPVEGRGKNR